MAPANSQLKRIDKPSRGTEIILHLREGEDELLSNWQLRSIIRKYSDHISLPIMMQKEEWDAEAKEMVMRDEFETVNQASALWTRNRSDITDEQYKEFYKHVSHDFQDPLVHTHNRVEGTSEYTHLLYIPQRAPFDLWDRNQRGGIKLYIKRVFIMDDAEQLMPVYLRFVKGVIDSSDLPLNVSREILQESRDVKLIRDGSTRRVIGMLESLANSEDDAEKKNTPPSGKNSDRCSRKASAKMPPTRTASPNCCALPPRITKAVCKTSRSKITSRA